MRKVSRRYFLGCSGSLLSLGCLGAFASAHFGCGAARPAIGAVVSESEHELVVSLAALRPDGSLLIKGKKFDEPLLLSLLADGTWIALRMYCPHKGCVVEERTDKLVCPCHGSEFARNGQLLKGPARSSLQRFPVSVHEQTITIHY